MGQRLQTQRAVSHNTVGKGHVCGVCCSHHAQGRVCAAAAATTTKNVEEFTDANKRFRDIFSHGPLPAPPRRKVASVTCMAARIHPEKVLGLAIGDAHVIRNAGGRVSGDALRSLVISQRALGTEEVIVIHHTKCGTCLSPKSFAQVVRVLLQRVVQAAETIVLSTLLVVQACKGPATIFSTR